ncbi:MAG: carbon-nitrogen hydrolase family protein [Robiginitomaculum sp.]|nr:carbon-nitrogen hydrolase family protein [Robiginitomaculum sp.]
MSLRAAVINLRCGADIAANLDHAEQIIRAAHKDGAKFIVTPENTLLMQGNTKKLFAAIKPEQETQGVAHFSALAKELGIDLLIGSMAIKLSGDKAANRSYMFGPDGVIKARYDKIHMFDVAINDTETWKESSNYQAGHKPVMTAAGGFNIGLSICYDLRFANLYKYYAERGAHILTVPAAFTAITGKAHWRVLLRARAIETSAYIVAAAQGGNHDNGRATWGRSMIVDPWGGVIAALDHDEPGYCCADLSLGLVNKTRARIPAWQQTTDLTGQ